MVDLETPRQEATLDLLRRQIEDHRRRRAHRAGWSPRFWPTRLELLDQALPGGGLPCGAIVEILAGASGVGSMSLAMRIATSVSSATPDEPGLSEPHAFLSEPQLIACAAPRASAPHEPGAPRKLKPAARVGAEPYVVLVDAKGDFYPPAAADFGLRLDRLIVLRVRDKRQVFWAVDQSLRCRAVGVVIASMADLDARSSRRLQLAAESSGALGLLLRPHRKQAHSFAAVRLLIEGVGPPSIHPRAAPDANPMMSPWAQVDGAHLIRITLLSVREGMPAGPFLVDLRHEKGSVFVPSVPIDRPIAKTG
ncbi:MAG: ImuA family protein [Phycisphaerae bacterium]